MPCVYLNHLAPCYYSGDSSQDYRTIGPYYLASDNMAYGRPVYYRNFTVDGEICSDGSRYELYLYTGRRWSLSLWCYMDLERYLRYGEFRLDQDIHGGCVVQFRDSMDQCLIRKVSFVYFAAQLTGTISLAQI